MAGSEPISNCQLQRLLLGQVSPRCYASATDNFGIFCKYLTFWIIIVLELEEFRLSLQPFGWLDFQVNGDAGAQKNNFEDLDAATGGLAHCLGVDLSLRQILLGMACGFIC